GITPSGGSADWRREPFARNSARRSARAGRSTLRRSGNRSRAARHTSGRRSTKSSREVVLSSEPRPRSRCSEGNSLAPFPAIPLSFQGRGKGRQLLDGPCFFLIFGVFRA